MTQVLTINGLDHWVATVTPDGTSEGIDYLNVRMYCGQLIRFRRYIQRRNEGLPSHEGAPNCFACIIMQLQYDYASRVMQDAAGERGLEWLHKQMGGTPI